MYVCLKSLFRSRRYVLTVHNLIVLTRDPSLRNVWSRSQKCMIRWTWSIMYERCWEQILLSQKSFDLWFNVDSIEEMWVWMRIEKYVRYLVSTPRSIRYWLCPPPLRFRRCPLIESKILHLFLISYEVVYRSLAESLFGEKDTSWIFSLMYLELSKNWKKISPTFRDDIISTFMFFSKHHFF